MSRRWKAPILALLACLPVGGCQPPSPEAVLPAASAETPDDASLQTALDEVLDDMYENRHLNLQEHAAWQILHGVLAFQRDFLIETEPGGQRVSAVEHLLAGGAMNGWQLRPGVVIDQSAERRGLIADLDLGSKTGQGHVDQWLAILAQCGLEPSEPLTVGGRQHTIEDLVRQAQWDVPRNMDQEYSWTLIGLTAYLPTTASWTAQDSQTWSIERLVELETQQDLASSACGGTHRLSALCLAINRHQADGHPLVGAWSAAEQKIAAAIEAARRSQNADGSFSSNYFQRGGRSADLTQDLGVSGHVLEFLALAVDDQQLTEPWMKRAVAHVCGVLRKTRAVPVECGALYHAVHGLVIYRQRVYGPRSYPSHPAG